MTIQRSLVTYVESLDEVAGKYEKPKCASMNGAVREGSMSLVFSATDGVTSDQVALKFIDPGIVAAANVHALGWFDREYQIMQIVARNSRSVNLIGDKDVLPLPIKPPGGGGEITLSIPFFPLEWLPGNVDKFFFDQANVAPIDKLKMLRKVFLAVRSIHQLEVAHRDVKRDNIRVSSGNSRIKLIDFGMAIEIDSPKSLPAYPNAMGANAFSPPECFLGLEGLRKIAKKRDIYSLGALIYSIFNSAEFGVERSRATDFDSILAAQRPSFLAAPNDERREELWAELINRSKYRLAPPELDGPYSSVPRSIFALINRIYLKLCQFDYRRRPESLDDAIRVLESGQRVLRNHKSDSAARDRKRKLREKKLAKQKARQERLNSRKKAPKCLT